VFSSKIFSLVGESQEKRSLKTQGSKTRALFA
jgi:hypothetical protein